MSQFPKQCPKCRRVVASEEEWRELEYLGLQEEPGGAVVLELRGCGCLDTLAIALRGQELLEEVRHAS